MVPDDGSVLRAAVPERGLDVGVWLVYESAQPRSRRDLDSRVLAGCRALARLALDRPVAVYTVEVRISQYDEWLSLHSEAFSKPVSGRGESLLSREELTVERFANWIALNGRLNGLPSAVHELGEGTGRAFMADNDPKPADDVVRKGLRIYPYQPGGFGTSVAMFLAGAAPFAAATKPKPTRFVDAVHKSFNTIPPNDDSYWDLINQVVQTEPAGAGDPEILGLLASVGIIKGKPFAPDARMRKILSEAVAVGNATARTVSFDPRDQEDWAYYPGSAWFNMMFSGGYEFLTPPPMITPDGVEQSPSDGARKINARIAWFYPYTMVTPAMCMRLTGIGSQYLAVYKDSNGDYFDGARSYKLTLPPDIPESRFWSVMVYDRQTRSMLQTDQPLPDLGSQSGTVVANADGTTDVYFGPTAPDGKEANWLQTLPEKGWFAILRLYNPLQSFFGKSWRPSEIEPV